MGLFVNNRLEISYIGDISREDDEHHTELLEALKATPKDISSWPKYLYDSRGSELFERITQQPEYYQTRKELEILDRFAREVLPDNEFGTLIELGSGSAVKTKTLIEQMISSKGRLNYVPLDVSESALRESSDSLLKEYPSLEISGYVGDFDKGMGDFLSHKDYKSSRLIILLGGTIGNFSADDRLGFLSEMRRGMNYSDRLLVGLDLMKETDILEAAYDDKQGVTAEFNKNVLKVLNATLGANFDPEMFQHRAVLNKGHNRIEMWLDSLVEQDIEIPQLEVDIHFSEGEGMRTELSHKFDSESAMEMLEGSGMKLVDLYTDDLDLFGLAFSRPE